MNTRCSSFHNRLAPSSSPAPAHAAIDPPANHLLPVAAQFAEIRDYNKHTRPLGVVPTAPSGEDDQEDPDDGDRFCLLSNRW